MASIKDVARLAGVSTSTVSRVLGQPDAVREELRMRVHEAIAELGYRPNLAARRLRQQRASVIGLIVADIRNPFFTDISRAVEDMAYEHGLRVILCNSDEDPAKEQAYLDLMSDEQASGVILAPTADYVRRAAKAGPGATGLPLVLVDRSPDMAHSDCVLLDNADAAHRLTRHLTSQGWRDIVLLAGAHSSTGQSRRAGYEAAMQASGLTPRVLALPPTIAAGQAATQGLLAEPLRPQAVLATNGLLLLGAQHALHAAGLRSPQDIALAGFDNNDWTALQHPGVTVIAQPTYDIGRSACELLLQRMREPGRGVRRIVLQGELLVRGSTEGPAPTR